MLAPLTADTAAEITLRIDGCNGTTAGLLHVNSRIDDLAVMITTVAVMPPPPAVIAVTPANGATSVAPTARWSP